MYDNGRVGIDCVVRVPPGTVVSIEREILGIEDKHEKKTMIDDASEHDNEESVQDDEDGEVVL
jgi:GTPase involved in cell partitioning and DNA repair